MAEWTLAPPEVIPPSTASVPKEIAKFTRPQQVEDGGGTSTWWTADTWDEAPLGFVPARSDPTTTPRVDPSPMPTTSALMSVPVLTSSAVLSVRLPDLTSDDVPTTRSPPAMDDPSKMPPPPRRPIFKAVRRSSVPPPSQSTNVPPPSQVSSMPTTPQVSSMPPPSQSTNVTPPSQSTSVMTPPQVSSMPTPQQVSSMPTPQHSLTIHAQPPVDGSLSTRVAPRHVLSVRSAAQPPVSQHGESWFESPVVHSSSPWSMAPVRPMDDSCEQKVDDVDEEDWQWRSQRPPHAIAASASSWCREEEAVSPLRSMMAPPPPSLSTTRHSTSPSTSFPAATRGSVAPPMLSSDRCGSHDSDLARLWAQQQHVSLERSGEVTLTQEHADEWHDLVTTRALGPFRRVPLRPPYRAYRHQVHVLWWLWQREQAELSGIVGGVLVVAMGLGKTLIALLYTLWSPRGRHPTLVVMSKTLLAEWKSAGIDKFFEPGSISHELVHRDHIAASEWPRLSPSHLQRYELVLTTYDVLLVATKAQPAVLDGVLVSGRGSGVMQRAELPDGAADWRGPSALFGVCWDRVWCDESQRFASPDSKTYAAMMALCARSHWCLTGTPIRNYDTDLWSQLRFCGYRTVTTKGEWKKRGHSLMTVERLRSAVLVLDAKAAHIVLPPCVEQQFSLPLGPWESHCYTLIRGEVKKLLGQQNCKFANILALFLRLRQSCLACHLLCAPPETMDEDGVGGGGGGVGGGTSQAASVSSAALQPLQEGEIGVWLRDRPGTSGLTSPKIQKILQLVAEFPRDEKIIIFSTFRGFLDLLQVALRACDPWLGVVQVDGTVTGDRRTQTLDAFRQRPDVRVLLMTYKVGSEGLNLVEANRVICSEPWWTASVTRQAVARCHRMGQTRTVYVYHLFMADTIEDKLIDKCAEKVVMARSFLPNLSLSSLQLTSAAPLRSSWAEVEEDEPMTASSLERLL